MGYDLRDIEVLGSMQSPLVRVTLDWSAVSAPPVGIEDCSKVHQMLGPMFDVWDPFPAAYTLEVSSPGEHPPLRTLKHFQEALGSKILFQTLEAIPMPPPAKARKNWEGLLLEIKDENGIQIQIEDSFGKHWIPLEMIKLGQRVVEWKQAQPKPGGKNRKNKKTLMEMSIWQ